MDERYEVFEEILDSYYGIVRSLGKYYNESREYGTKQRITVLEVHMIQEIANNPIITISDLTMKLEKTKGAISQTVEKLALKGLLDKQNDPIDTRKKRLVLTEDGKKVNRYHEELDQKFFLKVLKYMPDVEKEEMEDYLHKHGRILEALQMAIEDDKIENK